MGLFPNSAPSDCQQVYAPTDILISRGRFQEFPGLRKGNENNLSAVHSFCTYIPTSGPFGDSMSAAARPKRWGVFRQAKGREFDPSRVELFTQLT
jgi:hypothetical protein